MSSERSSSSTSLAGTERLDRECERRLESPLRADDDLFVVDRQTGNSYPCRIDHTACHELDSLLNATNALNGRSFHMMSTMLTSKNAPAVFGDRRTLPTQRKEPVIPVEHAPTSEQSVPDFREFCHPGLEASAHEFDRWCIRRRTDRVHARRIERVETRTSGLALATSTEIEQ
jgi:hypothetical protein